MKTTDYSAKKVYDDRTVTRGVANKMKKVRRTSGT